MFFEEIAIKNAFFSFKSYPIFQPNLFVYPNKKTPPPCLFFFIIVDFFMIILRKCFTWTPSYKKKRFVIFKCVWFLVKISDWKGMSVIYIFTISSEAK